MTREEWTRQVEAYLQREYFIGLLDCSPTGEVPDDWESFTPEEWADATCEHYGVERCANARSPYR